MKGSGNNLLLNGDKKTLTANIHSPCSSHKDSVKTLSSLRPKQNNRLKPVLRYHYDIKIKIIYLKFL